jgi:hypothetical protein
LRLIRNPSEKSRKLSGPTSGNDMSHWLTKEHENVDLKNPPPSPFAKGGISQPLFGKEGEGRF